VQIRRRKELGFGLGPAFARYVQENLWHAIHVQQGLGIVRQLITGKERHRPTTDSVQTLKQHVGARLITFAHHEGGYQAPDRREGNPHPSITIERPYFLGRGQMRFFLAHKAP
jgi:hypothetical protein